MIRRIAASKEESETKLQKALGPTALSRKIKVTRRAKSLSEIDVAILWSRLLAVIGGR